MDLESSDGAEVGLVFFFFLIYLFILGYAGSALLSAGSLQLRQAGAALR